MKHHWNYEPRCSLGKTPNFMVDAVVDCWRFMGRPVVNLR